MSGFCNAPPQQTIERPSANPVSTNEYEFPLATFLPTLSFNPGSLFFFHRISGLPGLLLLDAFIYA